MTKSEAPQPAASSPLRPHGTTTQEPKAPCCSTAEQASCCDPAAKSACCQEPQPASCGCR